MHYYDLIDHTFIINQDIYILLILKNEYKQI